MSTPPGKPLNPIAHVLHKAREGAVTELHPSEDNNDPFRSPYAPKRAHERAGTERHPVQNDRDPLGLPYALPKAGTPAVTSDFAAGHDGGPLPTVRAAERLHEHAERYAGPHLRSHDASGGGHAPERPLSNERNGGDHSQNMASAAYPNLGRHKQPAGEHRDEIMSDHDIERLEATLRWLRRVSATRLPRTAQLAPVPGLAPVDPSSRYHSGERFGDGFRAPRSLEPERLPPPPAMSRRNIGAPLSIVAIILVATIAYYFAVGGWAPPSEPASGPQTATLDPTVVAPRSLSTGQQARPPTMTQDDDRATSAQSEIPSQRIKTSQIARSSEGETVAMLDPAEPGAQVPPASKATRVLDPEEIKFLMKQGEQFIEAGDVVTARIVFQRAAEAGDASAAVALGATFDPIVLAKLGVVGLGAAVEKARTWYQKAEALGSTEATRRLAILANR